MCIQLICMPIVVADPGESVVSNETPFGLCLRDLINNFNIANYNYIHVTEHNAQLPKIL